MRYSLLIIIILLISVSCEREEIEKHVLFSTKPFSEVELNSSFNVYLIEDSIFSLEIFASEENLDNISYQIENEVLKINNERKYSYWL